MSESDWAIVLLYAASWPLGFYAGRLYERTKWWELARALIADREKP